MKEMMDAVVFERYGAVRDVVKFGTAQKPHIKPDEVLIQSSAWGVNPIDIKRVTGAVKRAIPEKFPATLGYDVSGIVFEKGSQVQHIALGDEVFTALEQGLGSGAFAEYVAVPARAVALKPRNLTLQDAAVLGVVGLTAWQAFREVFYVQPGHKILIHAGAGGVGTFAIQLAKHLGALVATTCSEAKKPLMAALGADVIIDYRKENFRTIVKEYDVVLDTLGGQTLLDSLYCLRAGGTLISVTGVPDNHFGKQHKLNPLVRTAIWMMNRPIYRLCKERGVEYRFLLKSSRGKDLQVVADLVERGVVRPVIDTVYPTQKILDALEYVAAGHATGKVVVSASGLGL